MTLKQLRNYFFISFTALSLFPASCTKADNAEPIYQQCLITKSYVGSDTGQSSNNFLYDNADRLRQIVMPGPSGYVWGTNITYGTNSISLSDIAGIGGLVKYYLTPDTLAYASATYRDGNRTDTVNYFYDANKFLVKTVRYNYVFGKDSSFLTYANNNLVLIKTFMPNGAIEQASYEYNNLDAKAWYYQNHAPYLHFDAYYPWFGRGNTKLISSFSFTYNGNPQPVSLTYNLNASGYVTSMTAVHLGISSKTNYEYSCR